jgi:hypothetical protein
VAVLLLLLPLLWISLKNLNIIEIKCKHFRLSNGRLLIFMFSRRIWRDLDASHKIDIFFSSGEI